MNEITTAELKKVFGSRQKFVLLDCRGVDYYNWEHLPHSVNLRWKYVVKRAHEILPDKDTLIITSCDGFTCNASVRCYENLVKTGYKNLAEYSGGIADWKAQGNKTTANEKYKITDNVYRFPDQDFAGSQVGSYLVEEEDFILLVDGPQNLTEEHEDFILHFGKPIKVFLTHGPTAGETEKLQQKYRARIYLHSGDINNEWLTVKPDVLIEDGYLFNSFLKVVHTPGHSAGSSVVIDSRNKILFSGDHLEGNQKGEIVDFMNSSDESVGDKKLRFKSAQKLLAEDFDVLLPFHYSMIRSDAKNALKKFINKYENRNH